MTDVSETLRSAARVLEETGWQQGSYGFQGHPHCEVGAVREAIILRGNPMHRARTSWTYEQENLFQRCMVTLAECIDPGVRTNQVPYNAELTVIRWNDRRGRTAHDVVNEMNRCAGNLEEQG